MTTIREFFSLVCEAFKDQEALWTPGWWYLIVTKATEELKAESSATDIFHLENLKVLIQKVTRLWSTCSDRWQVASLTDLFEKTGPLLALTFKTSLPSTTIESVLLSMHTCLNKDSLSKEICLDSALMTIMSTSSIPAPLAVPNASVAGEKRSRAVSSSPDTDSEATSESGDETTSSMLSYISFTKKGETRKRGLKEDVKDLKIIVSTDLVLVN
jgi:hypothetical protein